MKKLSAFLLTLTLLFTLLPAFPFSIAETPTSGDLDGGVHWTYADGVLTFTGNGALPNYRTATGDMFGYATAPWYPLASSVRRIVLSDGITDAGEFTFPFMPALESVVMAKSVKKIGYMTFSGCNALTVLILGDGLEAIGDGCFKDCKSLTAVSLPLSLKTVGKSAFDGCTALRTAVYPGKQTDFTEKVSVSTGNDPLNKALHYTDSPTTTGGLLGETSSWSYADGVLTLSGSGNLPDYTASTYSTRPFDAFADKVRMISFSDKITSVGNYLFAGFTALQTLTLSGGLTSVGDGSFKGCGSLRTVALGVGLLEIGKDAFAGCTALENAIYAGSVFDLEVGTGNEPLTDVLSYSEAPIISGKLSDTVTWSFQSGVLTVEGSGEIPEGTKLGNRFSDLMKSLILSEGITAVSGGAFAGAVALTDVSLPWSLQRIGDNAFAGCTALTTASYPGDKTAFDAVKVGNGNELLQKALLYKDLPVTGGVLSDTLTWSYENGVLTLRGSGEIPDYTANEQPWKALLGEITEITLSDGVTRIGAGAFSGCTALISVRLSAALGMIGENAFAGCASLSEAVFPGTQEQWNANVTVAGGNNALTKVLVFRPLTKRGDVNGDGKVNATDRTALARALANWSGYSLPSLDVGDINGDGKINATDRTTLARALANWSGYTI